MSEGHSSLGCGLPAVTKTLQLPLLHKDPRVDGFVGAGSSANPPAPIRFSPSSVVDTPQLANQSTSFAFVLRCTATGAFLPFVEGWMNSDTFAPLNLCSTSPP